MSSVSCPALIISSIASGQGKTTVVAGLAACLTQQGKRVRVFKCGPDFIDPAILEKASGYPVYQLDLWMVGERACQQLLFEAAQNADFILIEGVMGLFDGDPSTADLSRFFHIPILVVLDASAMAQTFGALVYGLVHYDKTIMLSGVVANRVNSPGHSTLLQHSVCDTLHYWGAMPAQADIQLPERHLGLHMPDGVPHFDEYITSMAKMANEHLSMRWEPVVFPAGEGLTLKPQMEGIRIGIAKDAAFCFIYQANLDLLESLGAELIFFSPLSDDLPEIDSLYLPGGYPELFAEELAGNQRMKEQVFRHYHGGKPVLAECGGLMYLVEDLFDMDGQRHVMTGLVKAKCFMQRQVCAIGLQQGKFGNEILRGHTFHFSRLQISDDVLPETKKAMMPSGAEGEWIFQQKRLTASYIHWYFPSNPEVIVQLLKP